MKISVVSGGFDPLHSGHIEYFQAAEQLGDKLIILLNSDDWLIAKKGKFFLPFDERKKILHAIRYVDDVFSFDDDQHGSCVNGLMFLKDSFPNDEIIFCNGGDRNNTNIPEMDVPNITFAFGVGGNTKTNSSSWILKDWQFSFEDRVWGKFYNLYEKKGMKIKELIVAPRKGMSFQRHFKRNEIWYVYSGSCNVLFSDNLPEDAETISLQKDSIFHVKRENWHQIINDTDHECIIIEIQYGADTIEDDIERLHYYNQQQYNCR